MEDRAIYTFSGYRDYLNFKLSTGGVRSGQKKRAAEALGVHTSFISQVLNGDSELSPEQAEKMNQFLGHSAEESHYFILQTLRERAGTIALKRYFEAQIEELKAKALTLSTRLHKETEICEEDQEIFYSSFLYVALHVMSSIPRLNRITELSRALGRPVFEIQKAVDFLKKLEVLKEKNGTLSPGKRHIHLGNYSPQIVNHHLNWRLKAIDKIRGNPQKDLHYSSVVSLSHEDVFAIKEILVKAIDQSTRLIVKSREETAFVFCLDFFQLESE